VLKLFALIVASLLMDRSFVVKLTILLDFTRLARCSFKKTYENLYKTSPHMAVLEAGDIMYIPHMWFHEVYTTGESIGVSTWVKNTG